jgi:peptidoglycan/LPS O-acetylase OafA/YrhL
VISGVLITTLLLREKEKYGQISLKNFYIRRSLRIFPLYYTVILIYVIVVQLFESDTIYGREFMGNLKYFLTYTSNWFVDLGFTRERVIFYFAWSLATEEQFYLIWSSVEYFLKKHWPVVVALVMIALQQAAANGMLSFILPEESLLLRIAESISVAVCLGVVLAHVLHSKRGFDLLRQFVGRMWVSPIAFLLLAVLIVIPAELTPVSYAMIYIGMAIVVASCVIREDHLIRGILSSKPARLVGTVSYGMYLLHMLTYNFVKKILTALSWDHPLMLFTVALIAATFGAWLSYRYYESFFLRMKSRFSRSA